VHDVELLAEPTLLDRDADTNGEEAVVSDAGGSGAADLPRIDLDGAPLVANRAAEADR